MHCNICGSEIPKGTTSFLISDNKGLILDSCEDCFKKAENLGGGEELKSDDGHFTIKKAGDAYEITYS